MFGMCLFSSLFPIRKSSLFLESSSFLRIAQVLSRTREMPRAPWTPEAARQRADGGAPGGTLCGGLGRWPEAVDVFCGFNGGKQWGFFGWVVDGVWWFGIGFLWVLDCENLGWFREFFMAFHGFSWFLVVWIIALSVFEPNRVTFFGEWQDHHRSHCSECLRLKLGMAWLGLWPTPKSCSMCWFTEFVYVSSVLPFLFWM